jgi:hypothetical protein
MYFRDRHGPYPDKTVTVRAIRGSSIRSKSNLTGFGPPVLEKFNIYTLLCDLRPPFYVLKKSFLQDFNLNRG